MDGTDVCRDRGRLSESRDEGKSTEGGFTFEIEREGPSLSCPD